jgi:hypothetical protein
MDKKAYTYNCDKCSFYTNAKSVWEKHIISGKHQNGERSTRCDKKYPDKCPHCDYVPKSNLSMKQHLLNLHATRDERR